MKRFSLRTGVIASVVIGILLVCGACFRQLKRYPHEHLKTSALEPLAKLNSVDYKLPAGESLASVARQRYGHQNYYRVIKLYNHIDDEAQVAANQTLQLPDMSAILGEEGVTKVIPDEVNLILCSRAKYDMVLNQLKRLRTPTGTLPVPADVKQQLLEAADDLQQAIEGLKMNKPGVIALPLSTIGQLQQSLDQIKVFADTGEFDSYGYDIDLVQQHYSFALTYAIIWARDGFR